MIISTVTIKAGSEQKEQVLEILFSVKGRTEGEAGCLGCRISQDIQNDHLLIYEEVWQGEENLNQHIRSDLYPKILAAMDLSSEPPKVEFSTVSRTQGMELIKEALGYVDLEEMERKRTRLDRPTCEEESRVQEFD
jgi:quinol monooxygenase YgiN